MMAASAGKRHDNKDKSLVIVRLTPKMETRRCWTVKKENKCDVQYTDVAVDTITNSKPTQQISTWSAFKKSEVVLSPLSAEELVPAMAGCSVQLRKLKTLNYNEYVFVFDDAEVHRVQKPS